MPGFPKQLENMQAEIDANLRGLVVNQSEPLYRMMEYQLRLIDEQGVPKPVSSEPYLHGMFSILLFSGLGADRSRIMPAALAVELAHHFMQVHTDVQDGDPKTPEKHSVWWIWGPAQAINAGDALHALSRLSLFGLTEKGFDFDQVLGTIKLFDTACLELFEGQFAEIKFQDQLTVSEAQYIRMTERRAGALFGCAFELPALLAGLTADSIDKSRTAGQKIGLAFQLHEEIQQIWGASASTLPSSHLLNKKKCLPIIHATEVAPIQLKRELANIYMKRVLSKEDIPSLQDILDSVGAREYCQDKLEQALAAAFDLLTTLELNHEDMDHLMGLIKTELPSVVLNTNNNEGF